MKLHKPLTAAALTALIVLGGVSVGAQAATTTDVPTAADAGQTWRYVLVNETAPVFPEPIEGDRVIVHVTREGEDGEFTKETYETTEEGFLTNIERVEGDAVSALVVPETTN